MTMYILYLTEEQHVLKCVIKDYSHTYEHLVKMAVVVYETS